MVSLKESSPFLSVLRGIDLSSQEPKLGGCANLLALYKTR